MAKRRYRCLQCGRSEFWGPTWMWYGSWKEFEDSGEIEVYCSEECSHRAHPTRLIEYLAV